MNLNYSILWFDDDADFFESIDKEPIETDIRSWGFLPEIIPVHNATDFNKHAPFREFDMLVVDFNLGAEQGDVFIKKVREQEVFTEVIFYSFSDASDLWRAVHDQQLEGVFVAHKASIVPKLIRVAHQSVRKVLDLENMRGIVMSEVGDLDALLENIFVSAMNGIPDDKQQEIFVRFHEKASEQQEKFVASLAAFQNAPSIEGLLALCDSDKRWQNFNRVRKHHAVLNGKKLEGDYPKEILLPRNFLAHGVPERVGDGTLLFRFNGKEFPFNDQVSQELRTKIIEYKTAFSEIVRLLEN